MLGDCADGDYSGHQPPNTTLVGSGLSPSRWPDLQPSRTVPVNSLVKLRFSLNCSNKQSPLAAAVCNSTTLRSIPAKFH